MRAPLGQTSYGQTRPCRKQRERERRKFALPLTYRPVRYGRTKGIEPAGEDSPAPCEQNEQKLTLSRTKTVYNYRQP